MTDNLQQAFDEGFDALKGYVDRSFDAFTARIERLEREWADFSTINGAASFEKTIRKSLEGEGET